MKLFLYTTLFMNVAWASAHSDAPKAAATLTKPNVIIILADDLGYGDVSCYGATKITTPNVDRLAREGMKFTDAPSAASVCSPSRYGLMTGRAPWRLHRKGSDYEIEAGRMTLASLLKAQGYQSAAIGKWHIGYSKDWNALPITGPLEVGFDYHFGVPQNHNDAYRVFIENHDIVGRIPGEVFRIVKGKAYPEGITQFRVEDQVDTTLTEKAVGFIREHRDGPFFLYFTPCAPHTHVTPAAPFRGTSQAGLLGDHIQEFDAHVGQVLATLDELKLADKTLVIFSSDNGSTPNDFKGSQSAELNLASEAGEVRARFKSAKKDAKALGHVTNGPWRDGKGRPFEGGHRVPCLIRWPGQIKPASTSAHLLCLTDLLATTAELLGVTLPESAGEDSISILPILLGTKPKLPLRSKAFIQGDTHDQVIAVRSGKWKLIATTYSPIKTTYQLYDLSTDPGETKDIAASTPIIVSKLAAELRQARAKGRTRL